MQPADTTIGRLAAPTAKPKRGLRRRWPLGVGALALLLVLALLIAGIARAQAPINITKAYFSDVFTGNADAAMALACANGTSDSQNDPLATMVQQLKGIVTFDISQLHYQLTSESINTAQVHVYGPIGITSNTIGLLVDVNQDTQMQLNASGLGWCVVPGHITFSLPTPRTP